MEKPTSKDLYNDISDVEIKRLNKLANDFDAAFDELADDDDDDEDIEDGWLKKFIVHIWPFGIGMAIAIGALALKEHMWFVGSFQILEAFLMWKVWPLIKR